MTDAEEKQQQSAAELLDFVRINVRFDEILKGICGLKRRRQPQHFHRVPVTQQRVDDIVDPHSASYFVDQSNGHAYTKSPPIKHPKYVNPYLDVKPAQLTAANLSEHAAHVLPYDERTTTSEMASKMTSETASTAVTSVEEGLTVKAPLTCGGNEKKRAVTFRYKNM